LSFPGVTPRGSRIRTGISFRCERVARHLGAEGAQILESPSMNFIELRAFSKVEPDWANNS
jgi:hypothetical protein